MGLSFLKKAASTLTRLMSRFTASSSRSMSRPNTSTRPSSRVSNPEMRRMRVDLPEPLAPRTPWIVPALQAERDVVDREDRGLAPVDVEALGDVLDEQGRRTGPLGVREAHAPFAPGGRDPRGGLAVGDAGRQRARRRSGRLRFGCEGGGHGTLLLDGWSWLGMGEPVRGVPGMGRAAGPVFGGLAARGPSGRRHAQINERAGGPVAHGSVVAPGAYAPRPTSWWAHLSR